MPKAIVLVTTDFGSDDSVIEELKTLEGVTVAHKVSGLYDILAEIEMNDAAKQTVFQLRNINGIRSMVLLMVKEQPVMAIAN
ncbi:MAG: AsnC family transcriptional regulator [Nitrososphaera sp.]|nr:AsnC family transcriptional regulator [Nitrososphaera sp.]